MGPISRITVSLRVAGEELDPAEITRLLGVSPKYAARKGDQVQRRGGPVTQRTGMWTFSLTDEASPEWELDDVITALLSRVSTDPAIWLDLGARYKLDVFCGLFMDDDNEGAELKPATL